MKTYNYAHRSAVDIYARIIVYSVQIGEPYLNLSHLLGSYRFRLWTRGPRPLEPKEIDELLVYPGKAYTLLANHLITGKLLSYELAKEKWFKSNHPYI